MQLLKKIEVSWETNSISPLNDDYRRARMEQAGYLLLLLLHATHTREVPPAKYACKLVIPLIIRVLNIVHQYNQQQTTDKRHDVYS